MRPIIVGSGMGGLSIALILKKNNLDPIIFEKQNHIGGSFHSYKVGDYQVDTGLHMLTRGRTGELPMLMKKYIDPEIFNKKFVAQKHYKFYLNNKGSPLPMNLPSLFKSDLLTFKDKISFLRMFFHFLKIGRVGSEKYQNTTAYDYIKKYITSDDLLKLFNAFAWLSTGCSIKEAALSRFIDTFVRGKRFTPQYILKHIGSKSNATEGDWYPKGGIKMIPKYFVDQGLETHTNKEVKKIIIKDNKVTGVEVDNKTIETNLVIYDGLVKNLNNLLIGGEYTGKIPKTDEYKAITIWIGFNKKIADWKKESKLYCMDNFGSPHWGLFVTDFDSSLASEGHQLFGMSSILHKDKEEMVKEMKETIEKMIPNYKDNVDMEHIQICRAEKTLQKAENSMWNLPEQKTNIDGLYIVGTDTRAFGSGGTMCADSANRCWKYIQKE